MQITMIEWRPLTNHVRILKINKFKEELYEKKSN
jgi:hypothetical protein